MLWVKTEEASWVRALLRISHRGGQSRTIACRKMLEATILSLSEEWRFRWQVCRGIQQWESKETKTIWELLVEIIQSWHSKRLLIWTSLMICKLALRLSLFKMWIISIRLRSVLLIRMGSLKIGSKILTFLWFTRIPKEANSWTMEIRKMTKCMSLGY